LPVGDTGDEVGEEGYAAVGEAAEEEGGVPVVGHVVLSSCYLLLF